MVKKGQREQCVDEDMHRPQSERERVIEENIKSTVGVLVPCTELQPTQMQVFLVNKTQGVEEPHIFPFVRWQ